MRALGAWLLVASACQPAAPDPEVPVPMRVAQGGGARVDATNSWYPWPDGFVDESGAQGVALFDPVRGLIGVDLMAASADGEDFAWLEMYADPEWPGGLEQGDECSIEGYFPVPTGACGVFDVGVSTPAVGSTLETWAATARVVALDRDPLRLSVEVTGETHDHLGGVSGTFTLRITELEIR
jgi:hypothetical protein